VITYNKPKIFIVLVFLGLFVIVPGRISEAKTPPQNGWQREYHANGQPYIAERYKKGILLRRKVYYSNGRILNDFVYKDGRPYKMRHFYDNGKLKSIWTRKTGVRKFYHRSGKFKTAVKSNPDDTDNKFRSSYISSGN